MQRLFDPFVRRPMRRYGLCLGLPLCIWMATASLGCSSDPALDANNNNDIPVQGAACAPILTPSPNRTCSAAASDYTPQDNAQNNSSSDTWPACISDDNTYHRIQDSTSTIARVAAYTTLSQTLWDAPTPPTSEDFLAGRLTFETDEGLGSRIARRYDVSRADTLPSGVDPNTICREEEGPTTYPDYCVGPATLQPIINEAFATGIEGRDRVVQAAKLEAALSWFLHVSTHKEANTCAAVAKDCDSAWAYYAGGGDRENPLGLASRINNTEPETHDRIFDGILATRCWRDLDPETPAQDPALQLRATEQLRTAQLRGMAVLAQERLLELTCSTGDYLRAAHEALKIWIPLLDHAARARNVEAADILLAEINREDPSSIDALQAIAQLDILFPCP